MREILALRTCLACLLAASIASAQTTVRQEPAPGAIASAATVADSSEANTLRFLALDHDGNPVTNLRAGELSVRIGDRPLKIVSLSLANTEPLFIGLFFDVSGSRRADKLISQEVKVTTEFLHSIWRPGSEGFVVAFGAKSVPLAKPTSDLSQIDAAILRIPDAPYHGPTSLYDALCAVSVIGSQTRSGERFFIVVGDFEDNSSRLSEQKMIDTVREERVRVFPLFRFDGNDRRKSDERHATTIAKEIARKTGGDVLIVSAEKDLGAVFGRLTNELQGAYRLTYEPLEESKHKLPQIQTTRRNVELLFPRN